MPAREPLAPEPVSPDAPGFAGPTMMTQRWRDAAFLHWALDPAEVAPMLPKGVHPDVHEGRTFVGLVPFRMVDAGLGRGPAVPWAGTFLETNVRLYTLDETGKRGIVFRSLDASRALVVAGARVMFGLPYRWARMAFSAEDGQMTYRTVTRGKGHRSVVRVHPAAPVEPRDHLADFLTARWGLHEGHLGVTWYVPNVHESWPLHHATLEYLDDELVAAAGFPSLRGRVPDLAHFSPGVSVRFGFPRPAAMTRDVMVGPAPGPYRRSRDRHRTAPDPA